MKIMIHACPARMWYVDGFLVPDLMEQGIPDITIWNDTEKRGNLAACMAAFASCSGDGGTWHLQDDVLIASDFAERAEAAQGDKIVCGFVSDAYGPDPALTGEVYMADMWNSFPCIYIPNRISREFVTWFHGDAWKTEAGPQSFALYEIGRGDDWFFREFMFARHGWETAINLAPCLVEHVDWIVGGSIANQYRGFLTRASWFSDADRVEQLQQRIIEMKTETE